MPEEYEMRMGWMSARELRSPLEKYWGQGAIPGASFKDGYLSGHVGARMGPTQ